MRSRKYASILAKIKTPALLRQKNAGISKAQKFICEQFDPNQCACDLATREVGVPVPVVLINHSNVIFFVLQTKKRYLLCG